MSPSIKQATTHTTLKLFETNESNCDTVRENLKGSNMHLEALKQFNLRN